MRLATAVRITILIAAVAVVVVVIIRVIVKTKAMVIEKILLLRGEELLLWGWRGGDQQALMLQRVGRGRVRRARRRARVEAVDREAAHIVHGQRRGGDDSRSI